MKKYTKLKIFIIVMIVFLLLLTIFLITKHRLDSEGCKLLVYNNPLLQYEKCMEIKGW